MGWADKVTTVAENLPPFAIYIYGEPGSGKTIFSLGAPKPLLLDVERGRRSLLNHPEYHQVPILRPEIGDNPYNFVVSVVLGIVNKDPFFDEIETIIIDTFSYLQRRELRAQVKAAHQANSNRHADLASQNEFNINNSRLGELILSILERTDKNLILVAHVKEEKDNNGATVLIRPDTSPGLIGSVAPLMDGIFYLSSNTSASGETERTLRILPSRKIKGKNRFGTLPPELKNPSFQTILDADKQQRKIALDLMQQKEQAVPTPEASGDSPSEELQENEAKQTTSILKL